MTVDRFDIGDVTRGTELYNQTTFTAANGYVKNYGSTVTYNGYANIAPTGKLDR